MKNFLFIPFALFLLIFLTFPSHSLSAKCNPSDKRALLQIKNALNKDGFLGWTLDTACCDWYAISCDDKTGRVISLAITWSSISGQIPAAIGDLPYLESLTIHKSDNLTGQIPPAISKLSNLKYLKLTWTDLSGSVPSAIGQLKKLTHLDLSFNSLSGSIPAALAELPNLEYLGLDRNKLTGSIPESFQKFVRRAIDLRLSHNQLTGPIPRSFGKTNFARLDFARNKLRGDISFLFGTNKSNLYHADFSRNSLEFDLSKVEFPASLNWLDLNHNKIFGSLPAGLTGLGLSNLNVSYNRLCGQIPSGGALQLIDYTAYFHNRCLCGAPLPPCK